MGYTYGMVKIKSYKINNLSSIFFIIVLIGVAQIYGGMIVEFFYSKAYVNVCRPLFLPPLWEWLTALLSAFIALFLLKVFKIKNQALTLLIALNLYLLGYALLKYYIDPNYLDLEFYVSNKTLIFSVTFLYLSVL